MGFAKTFEHSQALFDAALEEFIARGYEQASINTILETAGMSKGQFYYHFRNKEGLYLALIGILIARKRAFLASEMRPEDLQGDIFSILKAQIRWSMAFARQYPVINRFSESFLKEQGSPIYKKALAAHNFQDNEALAGMIERAYHNRELRQDLPLSFIKKTVGFLFTHFADLADLHRAEEFEGSLNNLVEFMKGGLSGSEEGEN